MTSQKIAIGLVTVALCVGSIPAHGADFGVGEKAYDRGDYATAIRIFRQLADQGDADAQHLLGIMYRYGFGVIQDYVEAVKWYRKAADQGHDFAQWKLGNMYSESKGVPQDYVQAHMWYNLAATGLQFSGESRDHLAEKMTPAQIAEAHKLAREWKPQKGPK